MSCSALPRGEGHPYFMPICTGRKLKFEEFQHDINEKRLPRHQSHALETLCIAAAGVDLEVLQRAVTTAREVGVDGIAVSLCEKKVINGEHVKETEKSLRQELHRMQTVLAECEDECVCLRARQSPLSDADACEKHDGFNRSRCFSREVGRARVPRG